MIIALIDMSVEGGDGSFETTEGVGEWNVHGVDEVDSVPLELGMLFLVEDNDDVPGFHARLLVALTWGNKVY